MATIVKVPTWRSRLTGQEMIRRFTLEGIRTSIDKSEVSLALILAWWGIVLSPYGPNASASALLVTTAIGTPYIWAACALLLGLPQLVGILLAWCGIFAPIRRLRMALLLGSVVWWGTFATSALLQGLPIAPVVYGTFTVLSMTNFRRAYLNGSGW